MSVLAIRPTASVLLLTVAVAAGAAVVASVVLLAVARRAMACVVELAVALPWGAVALLRVAAVAFHSAAALRKGGEGEGGRGWDRGGRAGGGIVLWGSPLPKAPPPLSLSWAATASPGIRITDRRALRRQRLSTRRGVGPQQRSRARVIGGGSQVGGARLGTAAAGGVGPQEGSGFGDLDGGGAAVGGLQGWRGVREGGVCGGRWLWLAEARPAVVCRGA